MNCELSDPSTDTAPPCRGPSMRIGRYPPSLVTLAPSVRSGFFHHRQRASQDRASAGNRDPLAAKRRDRREKPGRQSRLADMNRLRVRTKSAAHRIGRAVCSRLYFGAQNRRPPAARRGCRRTGSYWSACSSPRRAGRPQRPAGHSFSTKEPLRCLPPGIV